MVARLCCKCYLWDHHIVRTRFCQWIHSQMTGFITFFYWFSICVFHIGFSLRATPWYLTSFIKVLCWKLQRFLLGLHVLLEFFYPGTSVNSACPLVHSWICSSLCFLSFCVLSAVLGWCQSCIRCIHHSIVVVHHTLSNNESVSLLQYCTL